MQMPMFACNYTYIVIVNEIDCLLLNRPSAEIAAYYQQLIFVRICYEE